MGGFKTRFLLYTVPGQVYYNATRKLVLRGVDAVVFVADSARGKMNENIESLENLRENLREYGMDLDAMPWVLQCNKRDLPETYSLEELNQALNPQGVPAFEAVATNGAGVFETFKGISKLLLEKLSKEIKTTPPKTQEAAPASTIMANPIPKAVPVAAKPVAPAPPPPSSTPARAPISVANMPRPVATPSAVPATPAVASPVATAAPIAMPAAVPLSAEVLPLHGIDAIPEPKPSFAGRLARLFGKKPKAPVVPADLPSFGMEPPMAAPPNPRPVATIQLHKVEVQGQQVIPGSPTVDKLVRVPVPIRLTPEEAREGVTLKLIVELEVVSEGEFRKTGTA